MRPALCVCFTISQINNMAASWLQTLKDAHKTCMIQDGRRKLHYTLKDGTEMVEEYDMRNSELAVRKLKKKGTLNGAGKWEFEVGEEVLPRNIDADGLMESASNPIFVRKDKTKTFQWRIRNLPYPLPTYDVKADIENGVIIIKTSNKKYYKKFNIPDMDRLNLKLDQKNLTFAHANNTLIITYEKPSEVLQFEKQLEEEFKKVKTMRDGDVECNQS